MHYVKSHRGEKGRDANTVRCVYYVCVYIFIWIFEAHIFNSIKRIQHKPYLKATKCKYTHKAQESHSRCDPK